MAITLKHDDNSFDGEDSSGNVTITRMMVFGYESGDTQMDLEASTLRPHYGDAHPRNAAFTVESISSCEYSDIPKEYKLEVKYKKSSGDGITSSEAKPWELNVQNFRKSYNTIQMPLTKVYDPDNSRGINDDDGFSLLVNGAMDPIVAMKDVGYLVMSFDMNFEFKSKTKETNDSVLYNCNSETCNVHHDC